MMGILAQMRDIFARCTGVADLQLQLAQQIDSLKRLEIEQNNFRNLLEVERSNVVNLLELDRANLRNVMDLVTHLADNHQMMVAGAARRHGEAMTALLDARDRLAEFVPGIRGSLSPPIMQKVTPLEAVWTELQRRAPRVFPIWKDALDIGTQSYKGFPVGSCSVAGHPEAELFRKFLRPFISGNLLDIGCGPQPVPHYLRNCATERVFGIDPISCAADHPFAFVNAVAEFLPWIDGQFDTVVSATTLDHFFLLEVGLAEVHRVLRPRGHFVAWIAVFAGAPPYDPYVANFVPADREHLFHLDPVWFEPMMAEHFSISERLTFDLPFPFAFYAFQKK